jgi:hypothetical protein
VVTVGLVDDLPEAAVRELPPEVASVLAGGGVAAAGADGSPSRDRLARIAVMIRDAEQAMTVSGRRPVRTDDADLPPLATRRWGRMRLRRGDTVGVLAS